ALDIQQHPPAIGEVLHRSQNELVVEVVEEPPDIQVEHPLEAPAALPRPSHRLVRRASRAVAVRVLVEVRFNELLQVLLDDGLRDSVSHSRDSESPYAAVALRDLHPLYGRWHVCARRQSIPKSIEVVREL